MNQNLFRINHDCFRFDGEVVIYTDPYHVPDNAPKADLVLISHEHFDHLSEEDLAKIRKEDTAFIAPPSCADKLHGEVHLVKPGDRLTVKGIPIEVVPAYNTNKTYHPRQAGHVGYVFETGGQRIYFAGDTDRIPEMKTIACDIALLPVSGTYVMTADEAAAAARDLKAKVVVPMHYGDVVGTDEDAKRLAKLYKGETLIL